MASERDGERPESPSVEQLLVQMAAGNETLLAELAAGWEAQQVGIDADTSRGGRR